MAQNLKSGDKVKIIAGANKGTEGKIVKMDRENGRAMVEGVGVRERHMRATQFSPRGGKKEVHLGIDLSNLKLVEAAKYEKPKKKATKAKEGKK